MEPPQYEIKATCDRTRLPELRTWLRLSQEAFIEAYPPRRVNTIYFDTWDSDCLSDNLRGVGTREKLRFRWYGTSIDAIQGHLELKVKRNGMRWKILVNVPTALDLSGASWGELLAFLKTCSCEATAWFAGYPRPALITRYQREYYESRDHRLRATLDRDLLYYEQLLQDRPNLTLASPQSHRAVIEIKGGAAEHRRISDLLTSCPVRMERHSKYASGARSSLCFW